LARSGQVLVVEQPAAGALLADFLARQFPEHHPIELRGLVAGGHVRVNGEVWVANRRVRNGDVVQIDAMPAVRERAVPPPDLTVCFESATALVVDKPAGTPTVPDRSGRDRGIHGRLPALRADADLRIVHRLDRDTSGCLLLAKGLTAARHFDAQFRDGAVRKTYLALVQGVPREREFAIDAWLGSDRRRPGKVVAAANEQPGFRAAHTIARVDTAFSRHALLELEPTTGRSHQLRVHLQSVGHAIVGDRDYGGEELLLSHLKSGYKLRKGVAERPLLSRMFLHAARLRCQDVGGATIDVRVPLPEDLAVVIRQLQAFDGRRRPACD
jgi:RluA family pseudouridine synthase